MCGSLRAPWKCNHGLTGAQFLESDRCCWLIAGVLQKPHCWLWSVSQSSQIRGDSLWKKQHPTVLDEHAVLKFWKSGRVERFGPFWRNLAYSLLYLARFDHRCNTRKGDESQNWCKLCSCSDTTMQLAHSLYRPIGHCYHQVIFSGFILYFSVFLFILIFLVFSLVFLVCSYIGFIL